MSEVAIDVVALGLASPLGIGALATLTALQANLRSIYRLAQGEALEARFGDAVRASYLLELDAGLSRSRRAAFFAHRALSEALAQVDRPLRAIPAYLALPESGESRGYEPSQVFASISAVLGSARLYPGGRAGVFDALHDARVALAEGRERAVLVGAADSLTDPHSLRRFVDEGRLLGKPNADGLIPGEGAAFMILTRADARPAEGASPPLARLGPQAAGLEPKPRSAGVPSEARGLSEAFAGLRARARAPAEVVHCAQPPQQFWARELSYAAIRNRALMPDPMVLVRCSDALGELGCAAGSVALARAILELHPLVPGRPATTPRPRSALVYACSNEGQARAALIHAPPPLSSETSASP